MHQFSRSQKSLLWLGLQNIRSYHHAFALTLTFERGLAGEFDAPPDERPDVEKRNVNAVDDHCDLL